MRPTIFFWIPVLILIGCKSADTATSALVDRPQADFTIAFGSCNKPGLPNVLWDDVLGLQPNVWIWGGDNIYADTDDMDKMGKLYAKQNKVPGYALLKESVPIIGTWDDHDYGVNDGGVEFKAKKASQQVFLDFMDVPINDSRREREGIYASHDYLTGGGRIKVLVLDTRYFRTPLTPDTETKKRFRPNDAGEGTLLGEAQWQWLQNELQASKADFNIIVSSIQLLSDQHGFEAWGNFPHEVEKLKRMVVTSGAQGVIILSGDRHISEFSRTTVEGLRYPLVDFTSSGLTHAYRDFKGEPNPFRVGEVVSTESFGALFFDFSKKKVTFQMMGNGVVLGTLVQTYGAN